MCSFRSVVAWRMLSTRVATLPEANFNPIQQQHITPDPTAQSAPHERVARCHQSGNNAHARRNSCTTPAGSPHEGSHDMGQSSEQKAIEAHPLARPVPRRPEALEELACPRRRAVRAVIGRIGPRQPTRVGLLGRFCRRAPAGAFLPTRPCGRAPVGAPLPARRRALPSASRRSVGVAPLRRAPLSRRPRRGWRRPSPAPRRCLRPCRRRTRAGRRRCPP